MEQEEEVENGDTETSDIDEKEASETIKAEEKKDGLKDATNTPA